jgi:hypothetical protein
LIHGKWKGRPNWEVEKIIRVPINAFFDSSNYARYILSSPGLPGNSGSKGGYDAPAFIVPGSRDEDVLWGATYSIAMDFLRLIPGFTGTNSPGHKIIERSLPEHYYTGRRR